MHPTRLSDAEIVDRTLRLMREPLAGFVQNMTAKAIEEGLTDENAIDAAVAQIGYGKQIAELDTRILLKLMERVWNPVFWDMPGRPGRSYAGELLFFSNARSHQDDQKTFDAGRLVDTAMRLWTRLPIGRVDGGPALPHSGAGSRA